MGPETEESIITYWISHPDRLISCYTVTGNPQKNSFSPQNHVLPIHFAITLYRSQNAGNCKIQENIKKRKYKYNFSKKYVAEIMAVGKAVVLTCV